METVNSADVNKQPDAVPAVSAHDTVESKKKPSGKGPGRPRKEQSLTTVNVAGIVADIDNPDIVLLMEYNNPSLFRKLFSSLYKTNSVSDIVFNFTSKEIHIDSPTLNANNQSNKSLHMTIDPRLIKKYYTKHDHQISIKRVLLDQVFKHVDKMSVVKFILYSDTEKSILNIHLDTGSNVVEHTLPINNTNDYIRMENYDEKKFALQFRLPSKLFKNMIKKINTTSADTFTIQKYNSTEDTLTDTNLTFMYSGPPPDEKYTTKNPINDSPDLKMVNNIDPDGFLTCVIKTNQVFAYANACMGDYINIYLSKEKICLLSYIDMVRVKLSANDQYQDIEGYVCTIKLLINL